MNHAMRNEDEMKWIISTNPRDTASPLVMLEMQHLKNPNASHIDDAANISLRLYFCGGFSGVRVIQPGNACYGIELYRNVFSPQRNGHGVHSTMASLLMVVRMQRM